MSDAREVLLQAENIVGAVVFDVSDAGRASRTSAVDVATPREALESAGRAALEGKRASAILSASQLRAAMDALDALVVARAKVLVHVTPDPVDDAKPRRGRDEIAIALDTGAVVLCAWSAQESVDLTLAARRAAEDAETPVVLVSDGGGPVMSLPGSGLIATFFGPLPTHAAPGNQRVEPEAAKRAERGFASRAPFALAGALRELGDLTGRPLGPLERFATTDAQEIFVAIGQAFPAARATAEALRREGRRVGVIGVRSLRPFYGSDLVKAIGRARCVGVLEPFDVALAPAGPLATALKASYADALTWAPGFPGVGHIPPIVSALFATLDGSVSEADVRAIYAELAALDHARRVLVMGSDTSS